MAHFNHDEREDIVSAKSMIGCAGLLCRQEETLGITERKGGGLGTVGAALLSKWLASPLS